jgi:iron complex transport system substrate-binding protein
MRAVSFLPSATEKLYALGVEPVGVSHECDYPPGARDVPAVNRSRVSGEGSSADVNEAVTDAVEEGDVYEIDRDALRAADPDVVVTQGVCDVCAVGDRQVRETVADLGLDAEIVTTHPHTLPDVLEDVERIGAAVGREQRAASLVADLRERIAAVEERAPEGGPRVAVLDWMDPVMVAGHWVPGMIELAGGASGLAAPGERSTPREWAEIRDYDPELLVVAPCGFGLDQTLDNVAELTERNGWADLAAVRAGRVYAVDGHHYLNRPGPRLVDSLEHLAALLHPAEFGTPPDGVVRELTETPRARGDGGRQ